MKSESGSAVVSAIATIVASTLIFLSSLGLILAGHNLLIIKNAAISAAREGALAERGPAQAEKYALRLLSASIPLLASYQVKARSNANQVEVEINSKLPGIGFLDSLIDSKVVAVATKEKFN